MTVFTEFKAGTLSDKAIRSGVRAKKVHPVGYLIAAICTLVSALMLAPIALSLLASIKSPADAQASPPHYLPQSFTLQNYENVARYGAGLPTYLFNSLFVAFITIALCLLLAVPAAFGLARCRIRYKEVIFLLLLAPLMIPYQALLVPLYLSFAKVGLANSHLGLAIVHTMLQLPFSIYLMRNSFEGIPREIEEAARMDGANTMQMLIQIFFPLIAPGVVTVALFAFIASWNEVITALIFMNKETSFTVPIMLVSVRSGHQGALDWGTLQAGVVISIIPCILIYVFLQKYYVSGFLSGAVK